MKNPSLENELKDMFLKKIATLVNRLADRTKIAKYYKRHAEQNAKACIDAQRMSTAQEILLTAKDAEILRFKKEGEELKGERFTAHQEIIRFFDSIGKGGAVRGKHLVDKVLSVIDFIKETQSAFKEREAEANSYKELYNEEQKKLKESKGVVLKVKASAENDRARLRKFRQLVTDNMDSPKTAFALYNAWLKKKAKGKVK